MEGERFHIEIQTVFYMDNQLVYTNENSIAISGRTICLCANMILGHIMHHFKFYTFQHQDYLTILRESLFYKSGGDKEL